MATLYDYIQSLTVGGDNLIWSNQPLSDSQVKLADGNPYLYVVERDESTFRPLYQHVDVIQAAVNVHIFQAPNATGGTPDRSDAMQLYFDLYDAPDSVDAWIYGQPIIDMFVDVARPPTYDEDTNGLYGHMRFRLLFPRG